MFKCEEVIYSATLKIKLIFFEIARKLLLSGPTTAIIINEWRKKTVYKRY